ncbi:glycosyltransferase family 4 protein [bacterium]|nr:glycosyltransferase family 4 protein [bacterium]
MQKHGAEVSVISPQPLFSRQGEFKQTATLKELRDAGEKEIKVFRPSYFSFSSRRVGPFSTYALSGKQYIRAVKSTFESLTNKPDLIYGHALYPNGHAAVSVAQYFDIPSVVGVGESSFSDYEKIRGKKLMELDYKGLNGLVALSSRNSRYCQEVLKVAPENTIIEPNGVDRSLFRKLDKKKMRDKYNLPSDKVLVAFVGTFNQRKGPDRVLAAIKGMKNVGVLFVGSGPIPLEGNQILFKQAVPHGNIHELLSAADIFCLPTLNEGSSNATLEAMACGLPVVGSNREYNDEILDDSVAIRVDPMETDEIRAALKKLAADRQLRENMSEAAFHHAEKFDLENRAARILTFFKSTSKSYIPLG